MNRPTSERVCAVVVTYNRSDMLRECLASLRAQTRPVDTILVVDNASNDGTVAMLRNEFDWCQVLPLSTNSGGAGGFYEGMKWAQEHGFDWLWLMDDDGCPLPDCLQKLLDSSDETHIAVPLQRNKIGYHYGISRWTGTPVEVTQAILDGHEPAEDFYLFAFVGPLIPRRVVDQVGLPHANFFIYFDDWEYALRIQSKLNMKVRAIPDAVFLHDIGGAARDARLLWRKSVRVTPAPWKLYYGARNAVWTLAHGGRAPSELRRYLSYQLRWMIGDVLYEPDRARRVTMRARGIRDGFRGRMGKTVTP